MKRVTLLVAASLVIGIAPRETRAQQPPEPRPRSFFVGNRLGLPVEPTTDGALSSDRAR